MHKTSTIVSSALKKPKNNPLISKTIDEQEEPSDILIQNILNYSKSLSVKKSDTIGFIEVVIN